MAGYLIGIVVVVGTLIWGGFFTAAGNDVYAWVMHKIRPPEPEPVRVDRKFQPKDCSPGVFVGVNENDVEAKLSEGYSFYRHPEDGAKRFYFADQVTLPTERTFFMWQPVENKNGD